MTDRLTTLLHEEADTLHVPPAPTAAVLTRGRGLRRRRQALTGMASLAVVAALSGGAALGAQLLGGQDRAVEPAGPAGPATGHGAVFTLGTTVFYDDGARHVSIDDKAIKSTYYTSAGLLVRHGNNNASDGGGPQRFSLVTPDGDVRAVSVVTEETVPGVDPAQPYLAYTEVRDGIVEVVVHDVATDEEVARVQMPGHFQWGGWSGPPVALSGDIVYVGTDDVTRTVNWRTGEIGTTDVIRGYPDIEGGRTVAQDGKEFDVVDVATGTVLLSIPPQQYGFVQLSPDGRFAMIDAGDGTSFDVYGVDNETMVTMDGGSFDYGWSPDGELFTVRDHHVVTCSPTTAKCMTGSETIPSRGGGVAPTDLRYGNQTFES